MMGTCNGTSTTTLTADPFTSLAVHFGMLLGVPDFEVLAANPRGKLRLHQAWQHGAAVVWGYPVEVVDNTAELRVGAGLATDAVGREVALAVPHCIDVGAWLDEQVKAGVKPKVEGNVTTVDARLVVRFRACLSRPVPAVTSGCDGGGGDVAYSRVLETAELALVIWEDPPPEDPKGDYPRLRALFRDGRTGDLSPPVSGWRHAVRAVVAAEVSAMGPPGVLTSAPGHTRLFPQDEPTDVVLADLPGLRVVDTPAGRRLDAPVIDLSVRRTHLSTWMLQELLSELLAARDGPGPGSGPAVAAPRVTSIDLNGADVTVTLTADVIEGTIGDALEVRAFDAAVATPAWSDPIALGAIGYAESQAGPPPTAATITFTLPAPPTDQLTYRLVLRGAGPTPLVGVVGGRPVALAGWAGGAAGYAADGRDVVVLLPNPTTP